MGCRNSKVRGKVHPRKGDSNNQNEQPSTKELECTKYPANNPLTAEQTVHLALEKYLPNYNFDFSPFKTLGRFEIVLIAYNSLHIIFKFEYSVVKCVMLRARYKLN